MDFRATLIVRPIDLAKRWISTHKRELRRQGIRLRLSRVMENTDGFDSVVINLASQSAEAALLIRFHGELVFLRYLKHSPNSAYAHYSFFNSTTEGLNELNQRLSDFGEINNWTGLPPVSWTPT